MTGSGAMVVVDGNVDVVDGGVVVCGDVDVVGSLEVETLTVLDVVLVVCWVVVVAAIGSLVVVVFL